MRPKTFSYTPLDDDTNYFATGLTGATGVLTTFAVSDGLAHNVTLTVATDNLSTINITVTGLDADGRAQSEVIAGPNNNTVAGTKFFSRLDTITFGSTLSESTMDVGINDICISKTIPINSYQSPFNVTLLVDISGTINYDVEYTEGDVFNVTTAPASLVWFNHAVVVNKAADLDGVITSPVRALRLAVNSSTATSTIALTILQGG